MKKRDYHLQGKKNRAAGLRFEAKVRKKLETEGWVIDKWTNNVDLENGLVVPAKRKFNPFLKIMAIGTGFPDFIGFRLIEANYQAYEMLGVEVKTNGSLDKTEKEKCKWYLDNKIFSKIYIAKLRKEGRKMEVEFIDFAVHYGDKNLRKKRKKNDKKRKK